MHVYLKLFFDVIFFMNYLKYVDYQEENYSQVLPILSTSVILTLLKKRGQIGDNALIREFRQWLNNNK